MKTADPKLSRHKELYDYFYKPKNENYAIKNTERFSHFSPSQVFYI